VDRCVYGDEQKWAGYLIEIYAHFPLASSLRALGSSYVGVLALPPSMHRVWCTASLNNRDREKRPVQHGSEAPVTSISIPGIASDGRLVSRTSMSQRVKILTTLTWGLLLFSAGLQSIYRENSRNVCELQWGCAPCGSEFIFCTGAQIFWPHILVDSRETRKFNQ